MYRKPISIGYLDGTVHLLKQVHRVGGMTLQQLIEMAFADNIRLRGTWEIIVNSSVDYGWIVVGSDEEIKLGDGISQYIQKDDFKGIQRQLLWLYIKNKKPPWLSRLKNGIESAKQHITEDDEKQIFRQLGLMPDPQNNDLETAKWWLRVSDLSRFISQEKKTKTGAEGEFMTIEYEEKRTGVRPVHVAFESNKYGYDVQSQIDAGNAEQLFIEVKASTMIRKSAEINLTRFEYDKCCEYGENYIFHLWDLSGHKPRLLNVPSRNVIQHAPRDSGSGRWDLVKIKFDLFDWGDSKIIEEVIN